MASNPCPVPEGQPAESHPQVMVKDKDDKKRQNGEETRTRILDAAEQIFAERGFASTSTREIGRLARMDKYAIYYHFKNKESLYRAVIERSFSKITGFIDGIFPQEVVSLEELERIFEKTFSKPALPATLIS